MIASGSVDGPGGPIPLAAKSRASNALLVGASRSASGFPLAVFGPQVGYFSPEILIEMEIHAPGVPGDPLAPAIDARGAAFPGISLLVLLGRGRDFSWSATSAGSDLVDVVAAPLCEPGGGTAYHRLAPLPLQRAVSADAPAHRRLDREAHRGRPPRRSAGVPEPVAAPVSDAGSPERPAVRDRSRRSDHRERARHGDGPAHRARPRAGVRDRERSAGRLRAPALHVLPRARWSARVPQDEQPRPRAGRRRLPAGDGYVDLNSTFNWFYADSQNIAYEVSGNYPIRAAGIDYDLPYFATGQWDWQNWNPANWTADRMPQSQLPKDLDPAKGYMTSWNNAQAPGWNSADAELSYGPLHRSQPLDDRIAADASITQTELVQYMEDAGTVDLRGDKLVPVIAQLLGASTGDANADLGLQVLTAWNAAGAHRRDLDGNGVYDHAAAVALMDRWWVPLTDAVFDTLGTAVRAALPLGRHDAPGPVGSAFIAGWYGIVHKDLRGAIAGAPIAPFSRVYCGNGVLADCRTAVRNSLAAAVAALGPNPATWDANEAGDRIHILGRRHRVGPRHGLGQPAHLPAGGRVPARRAEPRHRRRRRSPPICDNCPFVANPGQEDVGGLATSTAGRDRRRLSVRRRDRQRHRERSGRERDPAPRDRCAAEPAVRRARQLRRHGQRPVQRPGRERGEARRARRSRARRSARTATTPRESRCRRGSSERDRHRAMPRPDRSSSESFATAVEAAFSGRGGIDRQANRLPPPWKRLSLTRGANRSSSESLAIAVEASWANSTPTRNVPDPAAAPRRRSPTRRTQTTAPSSSIVSPSSPVSFKWSSCADRRRAIGGEEESVLGDLVGARERIVVRVRVAGPRDRWARAAPCARALAVAARGQQPFDPPASTLVLPSDDARRAESRKHRCGRAPSSVAPVERQAGSL